MQAFFVACVAGPLSMVAAQFGRLGFVRSVSVGAPLAYTRLSVPLWILYNFPVMLRVETEMVQPNILADSRRSTVRPRERFDSSIEVVVIHTTTEGTLKALRTAAALAQGLGAHIRLLVLQVVPYALPLAEPQVPRIHRAAIPDHGLGHWRRHPGGHPARPRPGTNDPIGSQAELDGGDGRAARLVADKGESHGETAGACGPSCAFTRHRLLACAAQKNARVFAITYRAATVRERFGAVRSARSRLVFPGGGAMVVVEKRGKQCLISFTLRYRLCSSSRAGI